MNKLPRSFFMLVLLCYAPQVTSQIYFENQAVTLGIDDTSGTIYLGGGISFCDYNKDGWDDVTIGTEAGKPVKIYKNNQDGTFSLESTLNPNNNAQQKQVIWVDYDNDDDMDLFIASDSGGNRLYRNDGTSLVNVSTVCGINTSPMDTYGASWGDYDNDGFLDVFISNRGEFTPRSNLLYKNNGDGTFTDVTVAAGISTGSYLSFCSAFFDYNNDGWQDIYIANDKYVIPNLLYKNNGDGTFTDVSVASGTNISIDAMSVTIGDYNNDTWFDIYVTNGTQGNYFLKNNGDGTFTNIASATGTLFSSIAWGASFLDAENDGDLDLYVSGMLDGSNPSFLSAAFYTNMGNDNFQIESSVGFLNDTNESYANAIGDTDNDGFPEIIVNNSGDENISLWKNQTTTTNNWLKVTLEGVTSNKQGIGAIIEVKTGADTQYGYTLCGEGYLGQTTGTELFGIKQHTVVDHVKVTWLGGAQDILYNVNPNQSIHIIEGSSPLSVTEHQLEETIVVYPNPASEKVKIQTESNQEYKYQIIDVSGQLVKQGIVDRDGFINLSEIASGFYIIQLKNSTQFFNENLIIR